MHFKNFKGMIFKVYVRGKVTKYRQLVNAMKQEMFLTNVALL